MIILKDLIT